MRPRFHPEARRELREAADNIGETAGGASGRFVRAVRATVERALATPHGGALWPGVPIRLQVRRRRVPGYKYMSIAYTVVGEAMWIVAIVPDRRRPGYWFHRLDQLPRH